MSHNCAANALNDTTGIWLVKAVMRYQANKAKTDSVTGCLKKRVSKLPSIMILAINNKVRKISKGSVGSDTSEPKLGIFQFKLKGTKNAIISKILSMDKKPNASNAIPNGSNNK